MAARYHHTGSRCHLVCRIVQNTGGYCPNIQYITTGGQDAFNHAFLQVRARVTAVTGHDNRPSIPFQGHCPNGLPDLSGDGGIQSLVQYAADIVSAKNIGTEFDRSMFRFLFTSSLSNVITKMHSGRIRFRSFFFCWFFCLNFQHRIRARVNFSFGRTDRKILIGRFHGHGLRRPITCHYRFIFWFVFGQFTIITLQNYRSGQK